MRFISVILIAAWTGTITVCAQNYQQFANEYATVLKTPTGDICGSMLVPTGDSVSTVVLIIAGSGPTDRDGNQMMMRNNSLRMLALALADHNVATVRFDKRGIGASRQALSSEKDIRFATYVDDVKAWVSKLRRDGRYRNIVLLGHSEGALIASTAITQGARVNGLISLSGIGRTFDQVLKDQLAHQPTQIRDLAYTIIDSLKAGHQVKQVPFFLAAIFRPSVQPYLRSVLQYNPQTIMRNVNVPILILQGDADIQIKVEDARLLHAANPVSKLMIIPGMNHVLKDCPSMETQLQMVTYANPALPLSRTLITDIVSFINDL